MPASYVAETKVPEC